MAINFMFLAVLAILLIFTIRGYYKGFIRIMMSLLTVAVLLVLVAVVTPVLGNLIKEYTPIHRELKQACSQGLLAKGGGNEPVAGEEELVIAGIHLPKVIQKQMLAQASSEIAATGFYDFMGEYLADWIVNGIAFFVTLIVAGILIRFAIGMMDLFAKLPVVHGVNKTLGILAGFLQGIFVVWIVLFLVTVLYATPFGSQMMALVDQSVFVSWFYNNNGILILVHMIMG